MARRGRATVGIATEAFATFSRELLGRRGAGALPTVAVAHPLAGIPREAAEARVTDRVLAAVAVSLCPEVAR